MVNEVELKLHINQSDISSLKQQLADIVPKSTQLRVSSPKTQRTISVYFDTKELTLFNHEISIRLRRVARKWTQSIKSAGNALSGLHERTEIEHEVKGGTLDLDKMTDSVYADFFNNPNLRNALEPQFSTDVHRTAWQLSFENGDEIELVLDIGNLLVGKHREPICEIELELKAGNKGRLFEFALLLQQNIPLSIANKSKAQRAYAYLKPEPLKIVKAKPVKLRRKMLADAALKKIAKACLIQLQGNQDMVLHGCNTEGVHQMRIALRRLRSALKVFKRASNTQACAKFTKELVWITNVLSDARDFDVLVTETLPPILTQLPNQNSLAFLEKKAKQAREDAYTKVRCAINSQRYQHLLLLLSDWLENHRWQNEKLNQVTVSEIATTMLLNRYKLLLKNGKGLNRADPEKRHQTRIATKKLRYLAEFFSDLYPTKKTSPFIKSFSITNQTW